MAAASTMASNSHIATKFKYSTKMIQEMKSINALDLEPSELCRQRQTDTAIIPGKKRAPADIRHAVGGREELEELKQWSIPEARPRSKAEKKAEKAAAEKATRKAAAADSAATEKINADRLALFPTT